MIYTLFDKKFNDNNFDSLRSELSKIDMKTLSENTLNELKSIFNQTKNHKIEYVLSLMFADMEDENILPVLINKLRKIKHSNYTDTIIYACSEYDCAAYVSFFIELIIELNDSAYIEAIGVLEAIKKPILISDKIVGVKKLSDYLTTLTKDNKKYDDVVYAIELLERMDISG